ncbi:hypothetical protein BASA81_004534 [Batrachochytrium salamandrivorans]|nr:hypothetical protein BASA81_004534 [Batrachochytrium salamandrivorans]
MPPSSLPLMDNPSVMNMYRHTNSSPNRNPGLDNVVVVHEYTHGISNRLTGGPSTVLVSQSNLIQPAWAKCGHPCFGKSTGVLLSKHGFSSNLYDASQSAGNIVAMKIIIGGMMLQPCNPDFISARNAIITADVNHYGGANKCEIYKAFAKRGLGSEANNLPTNDFSVPSECQ